MPPRRSHRKSHNGCLQCKRRHVKCDEVRPCCGPCMKRELFCQFKPILAADENAMSMSPTSRGELVCSSGNRSIQGPLPPRTLELKLLHHFTTTTCSTFFLRSEKHVRCWRVLIPDLALEHHFLLDGLLAVSALHLAHLNLDTRKIWLQTTLRYQEVALAGLNRALSNIDNENREAVSICSILVLFLAITLPSFCDDPNEEASLNPVSDLLGVRQLLQGISLILTSSQVALNNGVLRDLWHPLWEPSMGQDMSPSASSPGSLDAQLVFEQSLPLNGQDLCQPITDSLKRLQVLIDTSNIEHQDDYRKASQALEECITPFHMSVSHKPIMIWPLKISMSIFSLLEHSDSLACLLFIHYGAILHLFSDWWFTKDYGKRLVRALLAYSSAVEEPWTDMIDWAKAWVGIED